MKLLFSHFQFLKLKREKDGNNFKEKGISLYFAVVILSVLLAMVLAVSLMIARQTEMVKGIGDSVIALNAAETGIEAVLFAPDEYATDTLFYGHLDIDNDGLTASSSVSCTSSAINFPGDACYAVKKIAPGSNCQAKYYCIKSIGYFGKIRRALEVSR